MRMRPLVAALALTATSLAGCGSACQDLANRICNCQLAGPQRDACLANVKNEINIVAPSDADQKFCEATLKTCPDPLNDPGECDALNTPAGKAACGLSF